MDAAIYSQAQWDWLLFEGALPLFGAGTLYLCWGLVRYISAAAGSAHRYDWTEALDAVGWLYGALIIAVQSAIRSAVAAPPSTFLKWGCSIGAGFCALLLLSAMNERSQSTSWRPPALLKAITLVAVLGILTGGFLAQGLSLPAP